MPAARGGVVTNGMSDYARDGVNANSALVVQVTAAGLRG
ncbi:MAG: FAD-dependent protein [Christensenellaceae bacterium]